MLSTTFKVSIFRPLFNGWTFSLIISNLSILMLDPSQRHGETTSQLEGERIYGGNLTHNLSRSKANDQFKRTNTQLTVGAPQVELFTEDVRMNICTKRRKYWRHQKIWKPVSIIRHFPFPKLYIIILWCILNLAKTVYYLSNNYAVVMAKK